MAAEAAVSFAVETLGNLLIQKVNFLQGVEGQVQWLRDELKRMHSFLKDAAEKQAKDERVRNWISEIGEVSQDAEDAIEIFILNVENATRSRGLLQKCTGFPKQVHYVNKVGEEIESIRKRLHDIESSRQTYGIENLGEGTSTVLSRISEHVEQRRRLSPWEKDKHLVGLKKDVELLLEKAILQKREGLCIAAIMGMGGIGKSTLARRIYNHAAVAVEFECRAWVVVSSVFTPEDIIKQIMLQLQISLDHDRLKVVESMTDKLRRLEMLKEMLHKRLVGKQYFIVLDDVWESRHWESLRSAFPDQQGRPSRLLFTSRNEIITKDQGYIHKMKLLNPDESWELLLKTAFIGKTDCPLELESIGSEILKKCEGLPLAITVAGGLLSKQGESTSGWEKVLKEIRNFHLGRSEISTVSAILELSYQNLPPELKACFLCLGFFEEDAIILAKRLVNIWIALGFVLQEGEEMMEETARGYLDELISRNLVQVNDMHIDDQVRSCHMHDLLRELAIGKAKEEISFEILRNEMNSQSLHKPRHRVMYSSQGRFVHPTKKNKHLRSLFFNKYPIHGSPSSSYWKSFELLRVVDLEGCSLGKLPDAIGSLIGLRYLGLRYTNIPKLPRSLGRLKNLQVLDIHARVKIPNVLWKMESLRHLYASCICHSGGRHLKIETLKNIQTLKYILLSDWLKVEEPTKMTSLRNLGIELNPSTTSEDLNKLFNSLAMLENLVCLNIRNCGSLNMDGLRTLHRVSQLKLVYSISRLPSASNFPPNLSYLTLTGTLSSEDPMPVLEKLPKLLYLRILDQAYTGKEMVISHNGFPRLKRLYLREFLNLSSIRVGNGAMPKLKQLEVYKCPCLKIENLPEPLRSAAIININYN